MKKILLVEDDEMLQKLFKTVLEKEGYLVDITDNVIGAANMSCLKSYDLYLVDLGLKGGVSGSKLIDTDLRPMVIVTAYEVRNLETVGYLRKPFKNGSLVETVKKYINE